MYVIFDFCKTLVDLETHDEFIKYILKKKGKYINLFKFYMINSYIVSIAMKMGVLSVHNKKSILLSYIKGISDKEIEQYSKMYAEEILVPLTITKVKDEFLNLESSGKKIVVISAGLSCYIEKFFNYHKIDVDVLANDLEFKNSSFTGNYVKVDCIGEEKVRRFSDYNQSEDKVYATFTDSSSDLPILNLAKYKYVVADCTIVFFNESKLKFGRKKLLKKKIWKFLISFVPDSLYLKYAYWRKHNRKLNIDSPKHLTEIIQYLKLYDRREINQEVSDKFEVRNFVKEIIGDEYLIPLLKTYKNANEVSFDEFKNKDVIFKCNHDSSGGIIKRKTDILCNVAVRNSLKKRLEHDHSVLTRERQYSKIPRLILVEELLLNDEGKIPNDLKIHCFRGEPKFIYVSIDREGTNKRQIFDLNWNLMDVTWQPEGENNFYLKEPLIEKPNQLSKLLELSCKLSKNWDYSRIDFYTLEDKIYFGEITLHPHGGLELLKPDEFDILAGSWVGEISKYIKVN